MGYRRIGEGTVAAAFPFGHGLSYTTFEYGKLEVTSKRAGASSADLRQTAALQLAQPARLSLENQASSTLPLVRVRPRVRV